jgi:hypothetical protein
MKVRQLENRQFFFFYLIENYLVGTFAQKVSKPITQVMGLSPQEM